MGKRKRNKRKNKKLKGGEKGKMGWSSYQNEKPKSIPPRVFINYLAKQSLDLYIDCCGDEISGLGRVEKIGSKFLITEILLLPQECTGSSTDLDEKALDEFILSELEAERNIDDMKVWWHSHVHMGAFWSGTDTDTIEKFKNGWFISIVGNKKGEYKTRLDLFEPIRYTFDEIPLELAVPPAGELKATIQAEITEKVKKKQWTGYNNTYTPGKPTPRVRQWDCATGKWMVPFRVYKGDQWVEYLLTEEEWEKRETANRVTKDEDRDLYGCFY